MHVIGVVAEYNPFHLGHEYMLARAKEETGADYAVVCMSGDFVQRGTVACVDKYLRTQMALSGGADLVIELPCIYATASAEFFARGAILHFAKMGIVDEVCFGTEHPEFPFTQIAAMLAEPPAQFEQQIRESVAQGMTYAAARAQAICSFYKGDGCNHLNPEDMNEPNTILGLEYAIAAHKYGLKIHPIKRIGNSHNDFETDNQYPSAGAIRSVLTQQVLADGSEVAGLSADNAGKILAYRKTKGFLSDDSMNLIVYHSLLQAKEYGYQSYFDCDADLSNRIANHLNEYLSFTQFAKLVKTKNYTLARVRRILCHIALNIKYKDIPKSDQAVEALYLRILGFRKDARELLSAIKKASDIPMLAKMANAETLLAPNAYAVLKKDIYAANLYEQIALLAEQPLNEMTQSPILL